MKKPISAIMVALLLGTTSQRLLCGYQLKSWRLIEGRKRKIHEYPGRMPKVFS